MLNREAMMDFTELSSRVAQDVENAISADLSAEDRAAISKIVQQALLDGSGFTHKEYKEVAVICCGPEADLAHKIQKQMDQKRDLLISNLMSMR
jgi:hypothetical protein